MSLPNNLELLKLFASYLSEAGLSGVSVKNYVSDIRHFLGFCEAHRAALPELSGFTRTEDIFQNLSLFLDHYVENQKATFTPNSTTNRRLASIRRFSTFLNVKYELDTIFTDQTPSKHITQNEVDQTTSPSDISQNPPTQRVTDLSTAKILEQFKKFLENEKRTHSTIKNYLSDLNHFFLWTANQTPFTAQNLQSILSDSQLKAYTTYLKLSHTSTSVINRRQSSIKKVTKFCFTEGYIPENPFEVKTIPQRLAPLAWMERLVRKPKNSATRPRNGFEKIYDKYSQLPWSPYLNMALLILLTTSMVIYAYNQVFGQTKTSSAATALTRPHRQLSFQGRLTDSSGTPITTAVNVTFKLYNQQAPGGSQLYTTGTCSITPDQDGIFNTLIGDGVCGTEIGANVFTDNRDVFLEISVGTETLTPRQQIATVGFALNSETLQGYPASAAATINTVAVIDNNGDMNIAASSPSIVSTNGTFSIIGQSVAIQTAANSGGDIILQPDALGSGQILALGATTSEDSFRVTNANLTTGALISGYVGNDLLTGRLISLTSGSSETDRFWVATDGRTSINASATNSALIINQTGSGYLIAASSSGTSKFSVSNSGDVNIAGQYLINGVPISGSNWQRTSGSLAPIHITDSINLGSTSTSSALVHLAGTSGDNSFVNTGNFGIGTTSPSQKLDVSGNLQFSGALMPSGSAGTAGQVLTSAGAGLAPTWTDPTGGSTSFTDLTSGTNTSAAMVVGSGASLNFTGTGTINASTLLGTTWSAPGPIGNTTPSTGAFTNLNITGTLQDNGNPGSSGQILSSTGSGIEWIDTSTINFWQRTSGSLAPLNISDALNIGAVATGSALVHFAGTAGDNSWINNGNFGINDTTPSYSLDITGDINITGALRDNGNAGTAGQILSSTGTGVEWIDNIASETASFQHWQRNDGVLAPLITTDDLAIGGTASSSALFHISGTTGEASSTSTLTFRGTTDPKVDILNGENFGFRTSVGGNAGLSERLTILNNGNVGIGDTTPASLFTVGSGDLFQVNSSGAIAAATGITSSGPITFSSLGTGIVHSNGSGLLSSSAVNLASADVTGILPIANGGTNNSTYTTNELLIYDGTKIASSGFTPGDFESVLTFSNGLTRTGDNVVWGGTLTGNTTIDQGQYHVNFIGHGNFGIGVASPSGKLDVGGILVVNSYTSRVGIGTSNPATSLEIAGSTATISNSTGDITLNSASGFFNFSGDSLDNILNATISGQLKLGNFPTVGLPTSIGTGSLVYDSTTGNPKYWDGLSWKSIAGFFERTSTGIIYPGNFYDSLHIGSTTPQSSASALIRLSSNLSFNTFFANPVAIGFRGPIDDISAPQSTALQIAGDFLPETTDAYYLGDSTLAWKTLYLSIGINDTTGTQLISIQNKRLTGGTPWNIVDGARIGDTSNTLPSGIKLYVAGGATISSTLGVVGTSNLIGDVTVGGGSGKIDVGTVDPPYTINGEKYATFLVGMIGVKEEVMGKTTTSEFIPGLGYRSLIDLDGQEKGSDLWLFGKTTNLKNNLHRLAVLLTAKGQSKTWYDIDTENNILAIYSSTPADVIYRLTAPRFDDARWTNTRISQHPGFVLNDPDINNNTPGTGFLNASISSPELIAEVDSRYKLTVNGEEVQEISSFSDSIIANLKVGTQIVFDLVADNLTVRNKLISPIADIDQLKVIDATVSGILFADNIKGKTVDRLHAQLDLLNEKYATASAILADLQAKYTSYDSLLGTVSEASISGDPLALSPLATTSATIPSDLALNSLNVHMILTNDIMANGSVLAQSFSSLDSDLFIQPTGDKPVHLLANLMTLYPDGQVVINGDLLVAGTIYSMALDTHTATVSGSLALGKGDLATDSGKLIALFDDNGQIVGSVDASGSANFGKLVTGGLVIAQGNENSTSTMSAETNSNTTIGTATIASGSAEVTVASNKVTDHTLIYITPISNTGNNVLYVKSKTSGVGFTVAVPAKAKDVTQEISFNYWLVETK